MTFFPSGRPSTPVQHRLSARQRGTASFLLPPRSRPRASLRIAACFVCLVAVHAVQAHEDPAHQTDEVSRDIAGHPDDAGLYLRRADLHRLQGDWSAAAADLQTARRLEPGLATVDLLLGQVLLGAGDAAPALVAIDRFVARKPGHGGAHLVKARILARLGRSAEAVEEFTRGIELAKGQGKGPQPDDYLDRARLQACAGEDQVEAAIRGLDDGAAALGGAVTLQLRAVELETRRRNWEGALRRLEAIEAKANRKEAWMARRAEILALAGRPDEARQVWTAALAAMEALPERVRRSRATAALADDVRANLSGTPSSLPTAGPERASVQREAACPEPPAAL